MTWILNRLSRHEGEGRAAGGARVASDEGERGAVLANVVIFGMVMMMIVAAMAMLSTSGAIKSAGDRNYQNAQAAAYAGLADYQSKLSNDNSYAAYGNSLAQFSAASKSTFSGGTNNNPAFSISGSSTWASVSGSTDEFYRYEVDNSKYSSQGILRVRVTGKSGSVTRSLVASLKGDGFVDYLYFTNYESAEPSATLPATSCTSVPQYSAGSTKGACPAVQFASGDVLNGPVRTNDDFTTCGATFNGAVQDAHGTMLAPSNTTCSASQYNGGAVTQAPTLSMPLLNSAMSQQARTDEPASVANPGCLYTGPTKVQLNANGTMTVWSPWTKATQITVGLTGAISASSPNSVNAQAECGSIAALQSASGATIPTLVTGSGSGSTLYQNLMYVQDVPTSNSPANVNYWGSSFPSGYTNTYCNTQVTVSGGTAKTSTASSYSNGVGYPQANEFIYTGATTNVGYFQTSYTAGDPSSVYNCQSGDVFVSGTFSGAMTIASSGTVWATGDITYNDPNNDILGLVGQDAVEVLNPAKCMQTSTYRYQGQNYTYCSSVGLLSRSAGANLTIDAAIASNAGTFTVQNYNVGPALGTLTVKGSIAQYWRGIVATSDGSGGVGTGFSKNYQYDNRLQNTAPPKFLQPTATTYGVTTQVEVAPAYNADGSCAQTAAGACR